MFDARNQLVEVSGGGTTTSYAYDGSGSRVKRIVDDGTTVTTTVYVMGLEIELVDGIESQRTVYYGVGGAFRIVGGEDAGLYDSHSDHLGSTSVLSDKDGVKVEGSAVVYAPFGEVRAGELSALTDFGYTGQIMDRSSGDLMYYGARYYLPSLRRFISPDTIVPSISNPQALNRYTYTINNPIKLTDPTGHYYVTPGTSIGSEIDIRDYQEPRNTHSSLDDDLAKHSAYIAEGVLYGLYNIQVSFANAPSTSGAHRLENERESSQNKRENRTKETKLLQCIDRLLRAPHARRRHDRMDEVRDNGMSIDDSINERQPHRSRILAMVFRSTGSRSRRHPATYRSRTGLSSSTSSYSSRADTNLR